MNVGILGGTFDPPHLGHVIIAERAMAELGLERVLFVPAGRPWMRAGETISQASHRVAMVRLAVEGRVRLEVSLVEVERDGPSYAVDTAAEVARGLQNDSELFFIMGWDCLAALPRWHEPERLLKLSRPAAVPRVGCTKPDIDALDKAVPGLKQRVVLLDGPWLDMSASVVRRRLAEGFPVDHLLPRGVEEYIRAHGLYKE